jgi:hypothetical protein
MDPSELSGEAAGDEQAGRPRLTATMSATLVTLRAVSIMITMNNVTFIAFQYLR